MNIVKWVYLYRSAYKIELLYYHRLHFKEIYGDCCNELTVKVKDFRVF